MENRILYFWGYLKQIWAGKARDRGGRLPFYLSEYVWHSNQRKRKPEEQIDSFLKLLFDLQSQRPKLPEAAKP